jgi:methyl-accepting chemotaxis protein
MSPSSLPTGRALRGKLIAMSGTVSLVTTLLISLYLLALLHLSREQWMAFGVITGVLLVILFVAVNVVNKRLYDPFLNYLDRRARGEGDEAALHDAFRALMDLPRRSVQWGLFWWAFGGCLVAGCMRLRFETFGAFSALVMIAAASTGGVVSVIFHYFLIRRMVAPVAESLGHDIPDPLTRQGLVTSVPLAWKLRMAITGTTLVTVVFAVFLAQERASRPIEAFACRAQAEILSSVAERFGKEGSSALALAAPHGEKPTALRVVRLDPEATRVVEGPADALLAGELRAIREQGLDQGDSTAFDSPNVFAWTRLPGNAGILVAVQPWEELQSGMGGLRLVFAVLLVLAAATAFAVAQLIAGDIGVATRRLTAEAERVAAGDLTHGLALASDDELGELAGTFARMLHSLRDTVHRLTEAAENVEGAAGEISAAAESVAGVTADQVRGIQQVTVSMDSIKSQVTGVAEASQALNVSVEESSSSILELGAVGEELNGTASVLSGKVDEVSSSIEQMIRSVRQVAQNAEALAAAAAETSSSMEEMASSLREVDANAAETARLSSRVVASAESGRDRVRRTIEGMDAIRDATDTAERVIRGLGERAKEIGAIVDVIDDVADETNLLALNAAIIAAQAGDHGRAFSVVADQIKDLADRVLASTKEIGGLIHGVQEESANAIGAIESGSRSVQGGVDLSAEAGVSLEEITAAARESGERIGEIVNAVREQAKAAAHVVDLMDRVRSGVEQIRAAGDEQERGNDVVLRNSVAMREVAQQVRATTEEQARGSGRIRESIESVRETVEQINGSLQEQSAASRQAVQFLERVYERTRSNEESARRMGSAMRDLLKQAELLREDVKRFRI